MKGLIVESLKGNGGRITFMPENEGDEYPVCATLWGKHDSPNIEISDVYPGEHGGIFADGINQATGILEKNFEIFPEQYWDIMHFIAAVLEWKNTPDNKGSGETRQEQQADKPVEIKIIFGSEAVRHYEETGEIPSDEWLNENGGVVDTKKFETEEQMKFYLEGIHDADGWPETLVPDDFMKNLLKEKRKLKN